jgi:hypothetical protein
MLAEAAVLGALGPQASRSASTAEIPDLASAAAIIALAAESARPPSLAELFALSRALVAFHPGDPPDIPRSRPCIAHTGAGRWHECCPPGRIRRDLDTLNRGLTAATKARRSPLATAAWAYANVCLVHPLTDGNGRLARAIASTVLLAHGWPPLIADAAANSHLYAWWSSPRDPAALVETFRQIHQLGLHRAGLPNPPTSPPAP